MDRVAYNACMSPYIRGKDKTKEERQMGFCVGAKLCSGKAKTEDEAIQICAAPRLPKWAAGGVEDEELSCPQRIDRTLQVIEEIRSLIKSGDTAKIKESLVVILQDIHSCAPEEVVRLANDTIDQVKKTTVGVYFAGEGREMIKDLDVLSGLLKEKEG
ncbi:MAG: hypothetical protein PHC43_00075 [Candidatus Marinimicrobia bacterium]|nr:hypothetical protein [Candidatus Neomarinimicrobiota bacterium]